MLWFVIWISFEVCWLANVIDYVVFLTVCLVDLLYLFEFDFGYCLFIAYGCLVCFVVWFNLLFGFVGVLFTLFDFAVLVWSGAGLLDL